MSAHLSANRALPEVADGIQKIIANTVGSHNQGECLSQAQNLVKFLILSEAYGSGSTTYRV